MGDPLRSLQPQFRRRSALGDPRTGASSLTPEALKGYGRDVGEATCKAIRRGGFLATPGYVRPFCRHTSRMNLA